MDLKEGSQLLDEEGDGGAGHFTGHTSACGSIPCPATLLDEEGYSFSGAGCSGVIDREICMLKRSWWLRWHTAAGGEGLAPCTATLLHVEEKLVAPSAHRYR